MRHDDPKQYALRITPRLERDIRLAFERFIEISGIELAQEWRTRLAEQIASLSTNPNRFSLVPEYPHFRREIRHLVFRRNASSGTLPQSQYRAKKPARFRKRNSQNFSENKRT